MKLFPVVQKKVGVTRIALLVLGTFLFCAIAPMVRADEGEELPSGEAVLDRYVVAMGGLGAFDKIENRVIDAVIQMKAQGLEMPTKIYSAKPNSNYVVREFEGYGKMESGCDGKEVWESSLMTGPVLKEGKERAEGLRSAVFDRLIYWRKQFEKAVCTGVEDVDGEPCFKVVATPVKLGQGEEEAPKAQTYYFSKKTGLLVKFEMTLEMPMGTIPISGFLGDYRKVDGVQVPFKLTRTVMGQEMAIVTRKVEHNADLPADRFDLPEDVKKLVEERDGKVDADAGDDAQE